MTFSVKYTFGLLACSVKQCYILTFDCLSSEELFKTIDNRDCSSLTKTTAILKSLGQVNLLRFMRKKLCNEADRIHHKHFFFDHCAYSGMYNFLESSNYQLMNLRIYLNLNSFKQSCHLIRN